ncbi:MAG: STAS domain-containing protein [Acidobacteriota bacterium]
MFEITSGDDGALHLRGRLDATQVDRAGQALAEVKSSCVLDCRELDYISSAGLGLLFQHQKRLLGAGGGLTLVNLNPHLRELFTIAGFDAVFRLG